jgi:hypothetical protein
MRANLRQTFVAVALATLAICVSPMPARADIMVTYDPSLGTLPEAQGFTFIEVPPPSPAR